MLEDVGDYHPDLGLQQQAVLGGTQSKDRIGNLR